MIRARCLHRSGHRFITSSVDSARTPWSGRKFYSAFAGATLKHELAINSFPRPPKPWSVGQSSFQRLSGSPTPRFASTTPMRPPSTEIQPNHVPPPPSPPPPQAATPAEGELLPASLDDMIDSIPPVYDHIGFLKEMGLDYGWGPTAFVETLLEHVHIYLGTPWWASIGLSILLIRAAMFKFYIDAADSAARRQAIKHLEEPITARMKVAQAEKNTIGMQEARYERSALHKAAGIIWWRSLIPLVQVPIGFGTFRLMRGMASLPVPGFDVGGLLWIYDLTVSDPYYFLPLATAWAYYYAFKKGGETGNSELLSQRSRQLFQYGIPIIGGVFMIAWPAGLQLTFCITALLSAAQATMFKNAWFRNLFGMQPLPERAAPERQSQQSPLYQAPSRTPSDPKTQTGVYGSLQGAVSDIIKTGEKYSPLSRPQDQKGRLTDAEKRHAETYEKRRQRELELEKRELAEMRFERKQEQQTQYREREERLRRREGKKAARNQ